MPYITPDDREAMELMGPDSAGDLNYVLTRAVVRYIETRPRGLCYDSVNEVVGVLECMKLELYRRVAAPYEDQKIDENGDVYPVEFTR